MRTLSSAVAGPLAPYAEPFAQRLGEQGYAPWTLQDKLHVVARLSAWLAEHRLAVGTVDQQCVCAFLHDFHHLERRRAHGDQTTLHALLEFLCDAGVLSATTSTAAEAGAHAEIVGAFRRHLVQERGLAPATVETYVAVAVRFLDGHCGTVSGDCSALQAHDAIAFMRAEARRLSPKPAQLVGTALRGLLRFLHQHGRIADDLARVVPTVADWRCSGVPKYLPVEQVEALLAGCDQSTAVGLRDYAVLLLLSRLGLRAGEVVHLRLEDVDSSALRRIDPLALRRTDPESAQKSLGIAVVCVRPSRVKVVPQTVRQFRGYSWRGEGRSRDRHPGTVPGVAIKSQQRGLRIRTMYPGLSGKGRRC